MTDSVAIRVDNLSKCYRIGLKDESPDTFGGMLVSWLNSPLKNYRRLRRLTEFDAAERAAKNEEPSDVIWAVRDVSFEVKCGEVLGIIGRNGAGKSTLLKMLSRITEPTTGRVEMRGRVASLLEVGTGFHPDLTGRENIYLNGTILGMTKREVDAKFDEIVDFSGVERFIDTPVKRYSSGMTVRLAFAVAAHLDPEILVIDEVLAVGDTEFQKKCLGKLGSVVSEGRTVLFVSHNLPAVQRLCGRCIVMDQGSVTLDARTGLALTHYLDTKNANHQIRWQESEQAPGNDVVRLRSVRVHDRHGIARPQFDVREPLVLEIAFQVHQEAQLAISAQFIGAMDTYIMASMDNYTEGPWGCQTPYAPGQYKSSCLIPGDLLNEGQLSMNLWIYSPPTPPNDSPHVKLINAVGVTIADGHKPGGARGNFPFEWGSDPAVRPHLKWTSERVTNEKRRAG